MITTVIRTGCRMFNGCGVVPTVSVIFTSNSRDPSLVVSLTVGMVIQCGFDRSTLMKDSPSLLCEVKCLFSVHTHNYYKHDSCRKLNTIPTYICNVGCLCMWDSCPCTLLYSPSAVPRSV